MPNKEFNNSNFSVKYLNSLKYLFNKGLGDFLTSFVYNLYLKTDLFTANSSTLFNKEVLQLMEVSLTYSIKDLNRARFFSKIDHFNTLKNICFFFDKINPDKHEETLIKINHTIQFYEDNKNFLESKGINDSKLYFLLQLKASLLYKTGDKKGEIITRQNIIDLLYKYKKELDENYIESIGKNYDFIIYDSFNNVDFTCLLYLINKYNAEISDFDLFEIREMLEVSSGDKKQKTVEKIVNDLENNRVSKFKQKALFYLINYLIIPYGKINELSIKSKEEKKLIIHYYYIKYLIEKNNDWIWKLNPEYKIYSEKVHLDSFYMIYKDFHNTDVDINFKEPIDILKLKHQIINEIINSNNPNKSKLIIKDYLDKINYEIKEHNIEGYKNDDEFIQEVITNNISIFKTINTNYNDLISLLSLINTDIQKLTFGLNYYTRIEKTNKLKDLLKSKLVVDINISDLNLRINICNNLEDIKKIKNYIENNYKLSKINNLNYIKLTNKINFLEYDIFEEQYLNDNKSKIINYDFLLPLAQKTYAFFIKNLDYFDNYNDYIRIIQIINQFNFEPNIQLINKYLSFYNLPGNQLTNEVKFNLDKNLGELYYKIKNYSKARGYFYAANANPLIYEDVLYAFQKWEILKNIFNCTILDAKLSKKEIDENVIRLKEVFETDINRIKNLNIDNVKNMLLELTYRYNEICIYEARNQNDYLTEKNKLIEQIEINNNIRLFDNFYNEFNLIKSKTKLKEISNKEGYKLINELYSKYNKKEDISFALASEELNDFNSSFNIQLKIYTEELINKLNYINKLSFNNQIIYLNEIWDHRQFILRPFFKLNEQDKLNNLNKLIEFFIVSDNVDRNNYNLYANNDSNKIDELILEKKKLFNSNTNDEDFNKISNNIDLIQQTLKNNVTNSNWNLKLLKSNLKNNQAYIRIFSHNFQDYFAFVVTNKNSELIDLNERKNIDFEKALISYMKDTKDQFESPLAFDIFYSKIFSALPKEINELFFQNEGVYINLNPDGFKSNITNKYLIEDYDIHTINSSYSFNNIDSKFNFNNALFIGNPKFEINNFDLSITSSVKNSTRGTLLPLPNTQNEVNEVAQLLNNNNINTKSLLQSDATEENLNKYSTSYELLHIATHGFYKDDGTLKINQYNFGLYLTGALDYINNNKEKTQMIDEGIIYAPEIELLNLSKTKLVVLSACETGFGRQSKIGKISLSSSFIMAGAKNVLSTLWKIDDKVTKEFINEFYKKLIQLKNIKIALKQTQLEFLNKYKSPYYWAPFMLLQNRG